MRRRQRFACFIIAATMTMVAGISIWAASNNVIVSGVADIWLAGQPNATVLGGDSAPTNSPVLASTGLNMTAGSLLTFSATGATGHDPCCQSTSPDGGGFSTFFSGPFNGIASYNGPLNALVGVFLDNSVPGGTAPAGLDFTSGASQSAAIISPLLNQVFFIGDGRTGTGSGTVQQFVIPSGATRLFIGSSDGGGANLNNNGSFNVTVSDVAQVPAMSATVVVATGLMLLALGAYALMRRIA
jgi:hypothetical protein